MSLAHNDPPEEPEPSREEPMVAYVIDGRPTTLRTRRQTYEERSRQRPRDDGPLFEDIQW